MNVDKTTFVGVFLILWNMICFYVDSENNTGKLKEFVKGVTIVFENPRVATGGVVRTINTTSILNIAAGFSTVTGPVLVAVLYPFLDSRGLSRHLLLFI